MTDVSSMLIDKLRRPDVADVVDHVRKLIEEEAWATIYGEATPAEKEKAKLALAHAQSRAEAVAGRHPGLLRRRLRGTELDKAIARIRKRGGEL